MAPALRLAAASGNVFGYLRAAELPAGFDGSAWARRLCPRGDGLGLDGLFRVEPFEAGSPWRLTHWDPDGGETFCSNGTRAAAVLLNSGHTGGVEVASAGQRVLLHLEEGEVGLDLPTGPDCGLSRPDLALPYPWAYGWTGTPHLVIEVPAVDAVDLPAFAPPLRFHPALPFGANLTLLERTGPDTVRLRSWERGVEGETLCCGQGAAVAGAWLAQRTGLTRWRMQPRGRDPVRVEVCLGPEGRWTRLRLSGRVRDLGELHLGPGLDLP